MNRAMIVILGSILLFAETVWSQDAIHFYNLGLQSTMMNKKIDYFTKALELNPKFTAAYEKRGTIYYYQGKHNEVIEDFLKVTAMNPSDSEAYRMLGLAYLEEGNHDEAIVSLTRSIELNPKSAAAYSHRAEAGFMRGMSHEAIEDATRAIELRGAEPIVGRAYTIRAKAYKQLGKEELADEDFKKSYTLDPENYAYRYFTITNHLASFVSDSGYINPRSLGRVGLAAIIGLVFVVIFRLALPSPNKKDGIGN